MAVYKEEKTGTWRAVYRYTDWNGERKQTQKRGFKTKREAQAWEREQVHKTSADLDMNFKSLPVRYAADWLYLPEQAVTTAIIVQTVLAVCIWILSPEIERQTAEGLWNLWAFGSERMASGRSSIVAGDVAT